MKRNIALKAGTQRILNYPAEFVTLPEYTEHAGQVVTVLRELGPDEYDFEGDRMYEVKAKDGWTGSAWESELEEIIHFGSWDDRRCKVKGTHRITVDDNEVNCPKCQGNDRVYLTEQGKQTLRELGFKA